MTKKRMLGLDNTKRDHDQVELIFRKTHEYTVCYNEDEYMSNYAGSEVYDSQVIDVDLGESATNLGDVIAKKVMETSGKDMVPAVLRSAYKDKLEELKKKYHNFYAGYIWKQDPNHDESLRTAVCLAETRGSNEPQRLMDLAKDEGILDVKVTDDYFSDTRDLNMLDEGFPAENTIGSLLAGCTEHKDEARTNTVVGIVRKAMHDHMMKH